MDTPYDAIIIGGGPAGLSAALVLGRCLRRVLLCDAGQPRNQASRGIHNFLTRDGISPGEFRSLARAEVASYGVEILDGEVEQATCLGEKERAGFLTLFRVTLVGGQIFHARKLLLATGLRDALPDIEGMRTFYGRGVHHCPYCDAHEYRGKKLVAFGKAPAAVGLALALRTWSDQVTACTQGEFPTLADHQRLERNGIFMTTSRILTLEGGENLERLLFDSGPPLECDALFFNTGCSQHSILPKMLGCPMEKELVKTARKQTTPVRGLYLAGDADGDVQFVIVAAGEGAIAATAINRELQDEDRGDIPA